ncbi:unnamed protein product [Brachionus calyciflorus]|uniref:ABHD18 n=1 Tax=Brachionus calyciflorus TaxID=104777 RepID=A0A813M3K6_9BILA|nr:unnamed protein product [Brachionus calyciflorus]
MSKIDQYYRKLMKSRFYSGGWGSYEFLSKIVKYRREIVGKRDACLKFLSDDYPVKIEKELELKESTVLEGSFLSPFTNMIPELMPEETRHCKFQFLIPKTWKNHHKPVVFHYAGTGDHKYWRRRVFLANPLLENHNVASLIIENPFYGYRKPKNQERSNLIHVRDLFVMGGCLVTEGAVLMKWCEKNGFGPFLLTGLSMGGHMASLTSTVWPKPVALVPCLSWTTAATVFTRGVLSNSVDWENLEKDYNSDKRYRDLKEYLKWLHHQENKERKLKKISSFIPESNIDYSTLINYSKDDPKRKVNMEIIEFMHVLMDECTHLANYDVPVDTNLINVVAAKDDAYVLRDGVNSIESIWPGTTVEYIDQGHVSAFVLSLATFRKTIMESMNNMIAKHYP